jgi:hypothetical protein
MVSSPGCSRIVPKGQNALWFSCLPSNRLIGRIRCMIRYLSCGLSNMLSQRQTGIARLARIYYLSWDEIAAF